MTSVKSRNETVFESKGSGIQGPGSRCSCVTSRVAFDGFRNYPVPLSP